MLSSSSLPLLLSPACTVQARSPLESSVPCLATRTLDDEMQVQRSPSVGWLSKSRAGVRAGGLGEMRARGMGSLAPAALLTLPAAFTAGWPQMCSLWNGCCSGCPCYPPLMLSRCSVLLRFAFFFPFIWNETGRSARAPLQAMVSLLSLLVAFLSSIEVSFSC